MPKQPTAHWQLPSLMRSLSRAGWGELAPREYQGVRATLRALMDVLPDASAQGLTTAWQLGDVAGLSERWIRKCLNVLEDMRIIEWTRGGVIDGKPQPSFIRVIKARLVELIKFARMSAAERVAARNAQTAQRCNALKPGARIINNRQRKRRSRHAELSASLSTPKGGAYNEARPVYVVSPQWQAKREAFEAIEQAKEDRERKAIAERVNKAVREYERQGMNTKQATIAYLKERWCK